MARQYNDRKYYHSNKVNGKVYSYYTRKGNISGDPTNKVMKIITASSEEKWNEKLSKLIAEYQSGEDKLDSRNATLGEVAKLYLISNEQKKVGTYQRKELYLRVYILPALKDMKVKNIENNDIKNLYNRIFREKTAGVLIETHKVLNNLLEHCIENELCINKNPISKGLVKDTYAKFNNWSEDRAEDTKKEYSIENMKAILSEVKGTRGEIIWHLNSVSGGLRISEALALQFKDIDLEKSLIKINKTVVTANLKRTKGTAFEGDYSRTNAPKTKTSKRLVPLIPQTRALVIELKEKLDAKSTDYLMASKNGKMLNKDTWSKNYFKPLMNKMGLNYSTHDLRKFFTSYHLSTGTPVQNVKDWLGHKYASTTYNSYAKTIDEYEDTYKWKTSELLLD